MKLELAIQKAEEILAPWAKETMKPISTRVDFVVDANDVAAIGTALRREKWGYLAAITGLDLGLQADCLEVLYHFCEGAAIATLRVRLPRKGGVVPSVFKDFPAASFFERELAEMYGVTVMDTPDTSRLFIPDDFPDGVYPMLKDFELSQIKIRQEVVIPAEGTAPGGKAAEGRFIIPIGPQHPALKEPGHFEFGLDGEIVTSAKVRLGYVHRGIEKACENQNWIQDLYLLERICGICSHSHSTAYSLGVEQLAQVEVSPRAQAIREVFAGLERIHSHMLWLGVAAHEAGFDTLFMYSWRDRETVMDILEQIGGNRVNYSISVLGGVKQDIKPQDAEIIRKGMQFLEERVNHYLDVVTNDRMFLLRTRGIGYMTQEQAEYLGILGPTARASGIARDIRIDAPYGIYNRFPVSQVIDHGGDLEARFKVRLRELIVSTHAIRTIVDNLPEGELTVRVPRRIPAGEAISRVEAPRGELLYYIKSNGSDKPERIKVRTPSLCNWTYVLISAIGRQLADVPLLLAGMDPCFSCNDR